MRWWWPGWGNRGVADRLAICTSNKHGRPGLSAGRNAGRLALMASTFRDVDPRTLRVPRSRPTGADPVKYQRQRALYGASSAGMPPPWVYEGTDGEMVIFNGVTRATRIAKLAPGTTIRVEVIGILRAA